MVGWLWVVLVGASADQETAPEPAPVPAASWRVERLVKVRKTKGWEGGLAGQEIVAKADKNMRLLVLEAVLRRESGAENFESADAAVADTAGGRYPCFGGGFRPTGAEDYVFVGEGRIQPFSLEPGVTDHDGRVSVILFFSVPAKARGWSLQIGDGPALQFED
jgi:hypothetical protein